MQDLGVLLENGLVTGENAADLSNMILGMDLRQSMGKNPGSGMIGNKMFTTPKNKMDAVRAEASMLSSEAAMKKAKQKPTVPAVAKHKKMSKSNK